MAGLAALAGLAGLGWLAWLDGWAGWPGWPCRLTSWLALLAGWAELTGLVLASWAGVAERAGRFEFGCHGLAGLLVWVDWLGLVALAWLSGRFCLAGTLGWADCLALLA